MPRSLQSTLISLLVILLSFHVSAQQVSNVNARLQGEDVIITYDLVGARVGQKFRIELYSSHNNYEAPLQNVEGDVGEDQLGGSGKQITWHAKDELGVFSGNVTFEVRSTITFNPIQITSPNASSSFKAGKSMPIQWTGGMPASTFNIELLKSNTQSNSIGTTTNTGMYNWNIPKDVSKGTDYQVRMYDLNDRINTEITSSSFVIKKKGGAGKILIPLAAVGATAGALCVLQVICPEEPTNGNGNGNGDEDLPPPPDPSDSVGGTARVKTGIPILTIVFGN